MERSDSNAAGGRHQGWMDGIGTFPCRILTPSSVTGVRPLPVSVCHRCPSVTGVKMLMPGSLATFPAWIGSK